MGYVTIDKYKLCPVCKDRVYELDDYICYKCADEEEEKEFNYDTKSRRSMVSL